VPPAGRDRAKNMEYKVPQLLQLPRLALCLARRSRALWFHRHAKAAARTAKRVVLVARFAAAVRLAFPEFAYALPVL